MSELSIEDVVNGWLISGLSEHGKPCIVKLGRRLLAVRPLTREERIKHCAKALKRDGYVAPSSVLLHALCEVLYANRNHPKQGAEVERARKFLQKQFEDHYIATASSVKYREKGKETVIHYEGLPIEYRIKERIQGSQVLFSEMKNPAKEARLCRAFLGSEDIKKIKSVYDWVIGDIEDLKIECENWKFDRHNPLPAQEDIVFYVYANMLNIDNTCNLHPLNYLAVKIISDAPEPEAVAAEEE